MDLADNIVDILNNQIGIEIGTNIAADMPVLDLASRILEVHRDEGLWTARTNSDGSITILRTRISSKQYNRAINSLNNLDQNGMSQEDREEIQREREDW